MHIMQVFGVFLLCFEPLTVRCFLCFEAVSLVFLVFVFCFEPLTVGCLLCFEAVTVWYFCVLNLSQLAVCCVLKLSQSGIFVFGTSLS